MKVLQEIKRGDKISCIVEGRIENCLLVRFMCGNETKTNPVTFRGALVDKQHPCVKRLIPPDSALSKPALTEEIAASFVKQYNSQHISGKYLRNKNKPSCLILDEYRIDGSPGLGQQLVVPEHCSNVGSKLCKKPRRSKVKIDELFSKPNGASSLAFIQKKKSDLSVKQNDILEPRKQECGFVDKQFYKPVNFFGEKLLKSCETYETSDESGSESEKRGKLKTELSNSHADIINTQPQSNKSMILEANRKSPFKPSSPKHLKRTLLLAEEDISCQETTSDEASSKKKCKTAKALKYAAKNEACSKQIKNKKKRVNKMEKTVCEDKIPSPRKQVKSSADSQSEDIQKATLSNISFKINQSESMLEQGENKNESQENSNSMTGFNHEISLLCDEPPLKISDEDDVIVNTKLQAALKTRKQAERILKGKISLLIPSSQNHYPLSCATQEICLQESNIPLQGNSLINSTTDLSVATTNTKYARKQTISEQFEGESSHVMFKKPQKSTPKFWQPVKSSKKDASNSTDEGNQRLNVQNDQPCQIISNPSSVSVGVQTGAVKKVLFFGQKPQEQVDLANKSISYPASVSVNLAKMNNYEKSEVNRNSVILDDVSCITINKGHFENATSAKSQTSNTKNSSLKGREKLVQNSTTAVGDDNLPRKAKLDAFQENSTEWNVCLEHTDSKAAGIDSEIRPRKSKAVRERESFDSEISSFGNDTESDFKDQATPNSGNDYFDKMLIAKCLENFNKVSDGNNEIKDTIIPASFSLKRPKKINPYAYSRISFQRLIDSAYSEANTFNFRAPKSNRIDQSDHEHASLKSSAAPTPFKSSASLSVVESEDRPSIRHMLTPQEPNVVQENDKFSNVCSINDRGTGTLGDADKCCANISASNSSGKQTVCDEEGSSIARDSNDSLNTGENESSCLRKQQVIPNQVDADKCCANISASNSSGKQTKCDEEGSSIARDSKDSLNTGEDVSFAICLRKHQVTPNRVDAVPKTDLALYVALRNVRVQDAQKSKASLMSDMINSPRPTDPILCLALANVNKLPTDLTPNWNQTDKQSSNDENSSQNESCSKLFRSGRQKNVFQSQNIFVPKPSSLSSSGIQNIEKSLWAEKKESWQNEIEPTRRMCNIGYHPDKIMDSRLDCSDKLQKYGSYKKRRVKCGKTKHKHKKTSSSDGKTKRKNKKSSSNDGKIVECTRQLAHCSDSEKDMLDTGVKNTAYLASASNTADGISCGLLTRNGPSLHSAFVKKEPIENGSNLGTANTSIHGDNLDQILVKKLIKNENSLSFTASENDECERKNELKINKGKTRRRSKSVVFTTLNQITKYPRVFRSQERLKNMYNSCSEAERPPDAKERRIPEKHIPVMNTASHLRQDSLAGRLQQGKGMPGATNDAALLVGTNNPTPSVVRDRGKELVDQMYKLNQSLLSSRQDKAPRSKREPQIAERS